MTEVKCKICSSYCYYNKHFTRFLALSDTQCEVFSCMHCKTGFLVGDPPSDIYSSQYFSDIGSEYSYEQQSLANCEHYRSISKKLVDLANSRQSIADLGCGLGHFIAEAAQEFASVEGYDGFVDPDKFSTDVNQLTICDIEKVVLAEDSYDAVTLNHSLEHVDDPIRVLENSFKGLKNGGVIYVEVPYQFYSFYDRIKMIAMPKMAPDFLSFHHKTFFNPSSLRLTLEQVGFEVIVVSTFLPKRGLGRYKGIRGKLLYIFLWVSSLFKKGDYISIFAKKRNAR